MPTSEQQAATPAALPAKAEAGDARIQEPYLNNLRKTRRNVVVYLLSGVRLTGRIASFDQHFIALQGTDLQVVNKDAIASIMPGPPMSAKRPGPGVNAGYGQRAGGGYPARPTTPAGPPRTVTVTTRRTRSF